MLHTRISAYANRNGILARLVALFPLLITSANVICSKFCEVWETLWIFKVVRWMRDRCPKINKSPTVSNGVRASSFEIWTANLAQSLTVCTLTNSQNFIFGILNWKFCSWLASRPPPKPDIQMQTFLTWAFFKYFFFFFSGKNLNLFSCWMYKNTVFANWGKYEVSYNFCLVFIIDF